MSDDVKIATRVALGVVGSILAIGSAIGIPVVIGTARTATNLTARVEACSHIRQSTDALSCVAQVIDGPTRSVVPTIPKGTK